MPDGPPEDETWPTVIRLPGQIFGCGVLIVDLLSGESHQVEVDSSGGKGYRVTVRVPDYPIVLVCARPEC